jgi:hypothetical protein
LALEGDDAWLCRIPLVDRARIVRDLCARTGDVEERLAFVELAFLPPTGLADAFEQFQEDATGQLTLDLGAAS